MAAIFISYRREDAAGYAGRLRESLERRLGDDQVFRDVDTLQPGQDFVEAIESRLAQCRVMLVVIGREWLDARSSSGQRRLDDPYDFVRLEVAAALGRRAVLLVPVLVEGASMPQAADLPDPIRALARRHAVSLRDETWDDDVDRLVETVRRVYADAVPSRRSRWPWLAAAACVAAGLIVTFAGRPAPLARTDPGLTRDEPASPGPAYTIDVPSVAEAAFQNVVYSVVSANVFPRSRTRELRLRIRLSNRSRAAVNLWDDSFRLLLGEQQLSPTSGLNRIMPGYSLGYGIVAFAIPPNATRGTLRITAGTESASIPLHLAPTGRPPVDEEAPIPDSLSQAIARSIVDAPAPLLDADGWTIRLERATARRFVNLTRLTLVVRLDNHRREPRFAGDVRMRASVEGLILDPWAALDDVVESDASRVADVVFDVPASAARVSVSATVGQAVAERVFDVGW